LHTFEQLKKQKALRKAEIGKAESLKKSRNWESRKQKS